MIAFYGRRALLDRIGELHRSHQHVSIVGARSIGKTALLEAVVAQHRKGSDIFAGAGIVDFRHDPPTSSEAALRRVGRVLRDIFRTGGGDELKDLADQINPEGASDELYDQLKIALDLIAEKDRRLLLVLDGCDPVLQNSGIPRNLWDNLRALGQIKSLRFMTGSRDRLHLLCYSPEGRTSDFFRIFYDEPLVVSPFDPADWEDLYASCRIELDSSARKELSNWTGGHPDLVELLLGRLPSPSSKLDVDEAAENLLRKSSGRLDFLWLNCSEETRRDIAQLVRGELAAADLPPERLRYLVDRGIAARSGNKVKLVNRFMERLCGARTSDASGTRQLFERPEDFAMNIRTVLELRLAQVETGDEALIKLVRRALKDLPEEPDAALGSARDIFDRSIKLVWAAEAPGGTVPKAWIDSWDSEQTSGRPNRTAENYKTNPTIPDARGMQCALLRVATGQQWIRPTTRSVSKGTCVLLELMNQVGDLKNHPSGPPTLTMAVAFCVAAIELIEALAREVANTTPCSAR